MSAPVQAHYGIYRTPGYAAGPAPDADFAKETVVRPAKAKAPRAVQKRRA